MPILYIMDNNAFFSKLNLTLFIRAVFLSYFSHIIALVIYNSYSIKFLKKTAEFTENPLITKGALIFFLNAVILAPLIEEYFFRFFFQNSLMKYFGPIIAITIASISFGILHNGLDGKISATIFGIILGWVYFRSQSIIFPILLHMLNNGYNYFEKTSVISSVFRYPFNLFQNNLILVTLFSLTCIYFIARSIIKDTTPMEYEIIWKKWFKKADDPVEAIQE